VNLCFNCNAKLRPSQTVRHSSGNDICRWCSQTVTIDRCVLERVQERLLEQVADAEKKS
jgi:Zn-finger nucleic acid-binding protein